MRQGQATKVRSPKRLRWALRRWLGDLQDSSSGAFFQRAPFFLRVSHMCNVFTSSPPSPSTTSVHLCFVFPVLLASLYLILWRTLSPKTCCQASVFSKGKCEAEIEVTVAGAVGSERRSFAKLQIRSSNKNKFVVGVLKTLKNNVFSCSCDPQVENHHHRT